MSVDPVLREDNRFYPLMVALAGCLCDELEEAGLRTCFCGPIAGNAIDLSRVSPENGGVGWVRLVGIMPKMDESQARGGIMCGMSLQAQIEVGFADCYPINDDGLPLSLDQELEATRRVMAGAEAAYRAAFCCDWAGRNAQRRVTPQAMMPGGPEGGVMWATWSLLLDVN